MLHHITCRRSRNKILQPIPLAEAVIVCFLMSYYGIHDYENRRTSWTTTRQALVTLRSTANKLDQCTRLDVVSLGLAARRRGCRGGRLKTKLIHKQYVPIPVVTGNRTFHNQSTVAIYCKTRRKRVLIRINMHLPDRPRVSSGVTTPADIQSRPPAKPIANDDIRPSIYVLNAAALSKPGAVQHLAADIQSYGVSVAIITETHYKANHTNGMVDIDGFTVHRRDRIGRRGGGVAVYVASSLRSSRW